MWLSNCFKMPQLKLRHFILKFIILLCVSYNYTEAQSKIGFKQFIDIASNGAIVNFNNNQIVYSIDGNVSLDSNKPYNLNVYFNQSFDTAKTILFNLPNNYIGSYFNLNPFYNTSNKLFYFGIGSNYGSSTFSGTTFVFGNANQSDYSLINHKAYRSKYYHRPNYTNTFLNDSTFISAHWFKWSHPSSLPYGASIWWFNKNMDTLRQQVYFETSGNTDLLPTTTYSLPNKDILVSGFTDTLNIYNFDAFLMRLDSSGNVKYARSIGTGGHENMYLTKIENKYYMIGTTIPSYSNSATSNFYVAEIDINTGDVGKTYKTDHIGTGIGLMHDPSVQQNKIYLPCILGAAVPSNLKSCYFLIDTNGIIGKQYIHSQASNGYWNSYTMPIITDSLKNVYGTMVSYNYNTDPHYTKLFKLDSNLVGCYPSDTPFSFTTTIATGAMHSLPMSIVTAKDSIFEVTTAGAIIQGHGFNTMLNECSGYVGIEEQKELEQNGFVVYPNPTNSIIYIINEQNQLQNSIIEITNAIGEVVFFNSFKTKIDISHLQQGIYFLTVRDKSTKKTIKIIKQ